MLIGYWRYGFYDKKNQKLLDDLKRNSLLSVPGDAMDFKYDFEVLEEAHQGRTKSGILMTQRLKLEPRPSCLRIKANIPQCFKPNQWSYNITSETYCIEA